MTKATWIKLLIMDQIINYETSNKWLEKGGPEMPQE